MLHEYFIDWSLKNLNHKKFNKNRKLHILTQKKRKKKRTHTHTYKYIKFNSFLFKFFLFWNICKIVSLSMFQITSLSIF